MNDDTVHRSPSASGRKRRREIEDRGNVTYTRRKALTACNVCRARKTKCDNELPVCGFCRSTNGDCQYAQSSRSQFDQSTQSILQRIDGLESHLASLIRAASAGKETLSPQYRDPPTGGSFAASPESVLTHREISVVNELEAPPKSEALLRASASMSIEAMLQWPVYRRHLPDLDSQMINRLGDTRFDPQLNRSETQLDQELLRFQILQPLIESFIANTLPCNPILDPNSLRQQLQEVAERGVDWDGKSCLFLLVCALGSLSRPADRPGNRRVDTPREHESFKAAERYFWASQLRSGGLYCQSHLLAAQCAFFTGVYLSFTMRTLAAWKAFAQAGTSCLAYLRTQNLMRSRSQAASGQGSESARHPSAIHASTWDTAEQRLRDDSLYWVILKGEAELCVELGLPASALHESPYPHIFPRPPDIGSLASRRGTGDDSIRERNHFATGWFYYLGEIALKRLQNRVLQHRFGGEPAQRTSDNMIEGSEELHDVREFDEQLDQWFHHLPEQLKFSVVSTENLRDFLRWVLRGHRLDVIEILRFPAFQSLLAREDLHTLVLRDIPPLILQMAREYLSNAAYRIEVHVEEFYHRHQGTWLTVRACTRSALALLGVHLACEQNQDLRTTLMPAKWRAAVEEVLQMLKAWEHESADVARLRGIVHTLMEHVGAP